MLKRFVKFICVVLCIVMLLPFGAVAEGGDREGTDLRNWAAIVPYQESFSNPFSDVTEDSWYDFACRFAFNTGFMVGTSKTTFSPHEYVTREMAVLIIANICMRSVYVDFRYRDYWKYSFESEIMLPKYEDGLFKDAESEKWYSDAVQWAYEKGVTTGIGDGYFGVGQPVTREDFLTMLYKVIKTNNMKIYDHNKLPELSEPVADYAIEAVRFFRHKHYRDLGVLYGTIDGIPEIINGFSDGTYHLKDYVTRAEVATMIVNLVAYPNYETINKMYA